MILQAGEVAAGYVIGAQHWRWLDGAAVLDVVVELGRPGDVPEGIDAFVCARRVRGRYRHLLIGSSAFGAGAMIGEALRAMVEERAITGGPWV